MKLLPWISGLWILAACSPSPREDDLSPLTVTKTEAPSQAPKESLEESTWTFREIARIFGGAHGLTMDDAGTLYASDSFGQFHPGKRVYRLMFPYDGAWEPWADGFDQPGGLLATEEGIYVCDTAGNKVHRFKPTGEHEESWDAGAPWSITALPDGSLITVSHLGSVQRLEADGSATTLFDGLVNPFAVAPDGAGGLWLSEQGSAFQSPRVTRRTMTGEVILSLSHSWKVPEGLALDGLGRLWIADTGAGQILVRRESGAVDTALTSLTTPVVLAPTGTGGFLLNEAGGAKRVIEMRLGKTN